MKASAERERRRSKQSQKPIFSSMRPASGRQNFEPSVQSQVPQVLLCSTSWCHVLILTCSVSFKKHVPRETVGDTSVDDSDDDSEPIRSAASRHRKQVPKKSNT